MANTTSAVRAGDARRLVQRVGLGAAVLASALVLPLTAAAQTTYTGGRIIDLTATRQGVLIRLDAARPTVCDGTPFAWMLVATEDKALMATTLLMWSTGKKSGVFYVDAPTSGGYCRLHQIDPNED